MRLGPRSSRLSDFGFLGFHQPTENEKFPKPVAGKN